MELMRRWASMLCRLAINKSGTGSSLPSPELGALSRRGLFLLSRTASGETGSCSFVHLLGSPSQTI